MKRVLLVQPSMQPPGGGNGVAAWVLQALVRECQVTVLSWKPVEIDWSQVIFKGLHLKGIYGREMFETWYKMTTMLQSGLDISPVITHRLKIDDYEEGFRVMKAGQSGKVILERVLRELPTGKPQSAPPIQFTASAPGDYKIEIWQLYGKQRGDAILHVL